MKVRHAYLLTPIFLATASGLVALGCAERTKPEPNLQSDMRDVYRSARELFGYVWSPSSFYAESSERRISSLLDSLQENFHRAELDAPIEVFEPGFRVTLLAQKNLLADASNRFKEGKKEYANWQLRGMASNCISCHSRYQAPVNFVGELPPIEDMSPEGRLASAEFLFATRQFDKASESLFRSAERMAAVPSLGAFQIRALKMWLVIEVRTKDRPLDSAQRLESYLNSNRIPEGYGATFGRWVSDLKQLGSAPAVTSDPLREADTLLRPLGDDSTIQSEEQHLVLTLKATALLHDYLQRSLSTDERRRGTFLLGVAYSHLPISLFTSFGPYYLEMTIRDFPHSNEALRAFELFERALMDDLGASGGGNLAPDQLKLLQELRKLAYPRQLSPPVASNRRAP